VLKTIPEEVIVDETDERPERDEDLENIIEKFANDIRKLRDKQTPRDDTYDRSRSYQKVAD
jgi:hypothetical protein